jgi:hypothetical protein
MPRARGGALLVAIGLAACRPVPPADVVIFGPVWTGDPAEPTARAVAIRGDTITAVGDSQAVAAMVGPKTRVEHAAGLVVPGFIDDHVHFLEGGVQLTSVELRDAASPGEFIRRLKEFASKAEPGSWILGGDWDHELWGGTPLPDRAWIDSVTPKNPVWVQRLDGHMGLANSLALKLAHLDRRSPSVAGGTIVRRPDGDLTGLLKDVAGEPVTAAIPAPTDAQYDSIVARVGRHAASLGVTGMSSVSTSWAMIAALRRARARGALTLRVSNYLPLGAWRSVADSVAAHGVGDQWIRTAGVKGLMDGSLGSTTAYFDAPFSDAPSTSGFLTMSEDSARRWIGAADSAGLQAAVHAIGDRANGLLLDIYDSVARAHGERDRRFRIEHAQHLRPRDIPRFAALHVIPSMQPYHAADDGRWAEKRIGPERIKTTYAFRSLLDAGARLTFGSDWFVAPLDPLLGVKAAVTRQTIDGKHPGGWVPEQKITVDEALRAYTGNNAYAMFMDRSIGRLAPGYQADLVILDRNLLTMPADSLDRARVALTMVGGKVSYRRP